MLWKPVKALISQSTLTVHGPAVQKLGLEVLLSFPQVSISLKVKNQKVIGMCPLYAPKFNSFYLNSLQFTLELFRYSKKI